MSKLVTVVCNVLATHLQERQAQSLCLNLKFEYKVRNNAVKVVNLNMTSCEPARCSAYTSDQRWRMVWQMEALGLSSEQVAKNLGFDKSTVSRIRQKFHTSGCIKTYPKSEAYISSIATCSAFGAKSSIMKFKRNW